MWEVYLDRDDIDFLFDLTLGIQVTEDTDKKQIERILHALEYASIPAKHEEVECKQRTGADDNG